MQQELTIEQMMKQTNKWKQTNIIKVEQILKQTN